MSLHGAIILQTYYDPGAPNPRTTQFFCIRGSRAIYHEGWKAVSIHKNGTDFEKDKF